MNCTISGSNDLDEVLVFLPDGREVFAMERLGDGSFRVVEAQTWQPGQPVPGGYRKTGPLKSLVFHAHEFIGRRVAPSECEPMPERIVSGVFCQSEFNDVHRSTNGIGGRDCRRTSATIFRSDRMTIRCPRCKRQTGRVA